MTETTRNLKAVRASWKRLHGRCMWVADGNHGRLEGWLVNGEFRIIHTHEADSGIEIFAPIAGQTLAELLDSATPAEEKVEITPDMAAVL